MQGAAESDALTIVEELIYSHAVRIDSDTAALQQWSELQSHVARLAELRSTLWEEAGKEVRKNLRRDKRRELVSSFVKTPVGQATGGPPRTWEGNPGNADSGWTF